MSFDLTDEQRSFRDVMRSFVDERIAPNAARYDREQVYPKDSFDACVEMELPSLGVPEKFGGAGADMVTQAIMIEEIARGCASTSVTILISKLGMLPVMNFGSDELKQRYLPRHRGREIQASYCLSEADAGSDVAVDALSRRTRRGRLHLERVEVLDHQCGHLRHLYRVREDRSGALGREASRASLSKRGGA